MSYQNKVIIQIEHCENCHLHEWCSRHDQKKYKDHAQRVRSYARDIFPQCQIRVNQLDNSYEQLNQKGEKGETKYYNHKNSQIVNFPKFGSFELYVNGTLIFSKIESNLWPKHERIAQLFEKIKQELNNSNQLEKYSLEYRLKNDNDQYFRDTYKKLIEKNYNVHQRPLSQNFNETTNTFVNRSPASLKKGNQNFISRKLHQSLKKQNQNLEKLQEKYDFIKPYQTRSGPKSNYRRPLTNQLPKHRTHELLQNNHQNSSSFGEFQQGIVKSNDIVQSNFKGSPNPRKRLQIIRDHPLKQGQAQQKSSPFEKQKQYVSIKPVGKNNIKKINNRFLNQNNSSGRNNKRETNPLLNSSSDKDVQVNLRRVLVNTKASDPQHDEAQKLIEQVNQDLSKQLDENEKEQDLIAKLQKQQIQQENINMIKSSGRQIQQKSKRDIETNNLLQQKRLKKNEQSIKNISQSENKKSQTEQIIENNSSNQILQPKFASEKLASQKQLSKNTEKQIVNNVNVTNVQSAEQEKYEQQPMEQQYAQQQFEENQQINVKQPPQNTTSTKTLQNNPQTNNNISAKRQNEDQVIQQNQYNNQVEQYQQQIMDEQQQPHQKQVSNNVGISQKNNTSPPLSNLNQESTPIESVLEVPSQDERKKKSISIEISVNQSKIKELDAIKQTQELHLNKQDNHEPTSDIKGWSKKENQYSQNQFVNENKADQTSSKFEISKEQKNVENEYQENIHSEKSEQKSVKSIIQQQKVLTNKQLSSKSIKKQQSVQNIQNKVEQNQYIIENSPQQQQKEQIQQHEQYDENPQFEEQQLEQEEQGQRPESRSNYNRSQIHNLQHKKQDEFNIDHQQNERPLTSAYTKEHSAKHLTEQVANEVQEVKQQHQLAVNHQKQRHLEELLPEQEQSHRSIPIIVSTHEGTSKIIAEEVNKELEQMYERQEESRLKMEKVLEKIGQQEDNKQEEQQQAQKQQEEQSEKPSLHEDQYEQQIAPSHHSVEKQQQVIVEQDNKSENINNDEKNRVETEKQVEQNDVKSEKNVIVEEQVEKEKSIQQIPQEENKHEQVVVEKLSEKQIQKQSENNIEQQIEVPNGQQPTQQNMPQLIDNIEQSEHSIKPVQESTEKYVTNYVQQLNDKIHNNNLQSSKTVEIKNEEVLKEDNKQIVQIEKQKVEQNVDQIMDKQPQEQKIVQKQVEQPFKQDIKEQQQYEQQIKSEKQSSKKEVNDQIKSDVHSQKVLEQNKKLESNDEHIQIEQPITSLPIEQQSHQNIVEQPSEQIIPKQSSNNIQVEQNTQKLISQYVDEMNNKVNEQKLSSNQQLPKQQHQPQIKQVKLQQIQEISQVPVIQQPIQSHQQEQKQIIKQQKQQKLQKQQIVNEQKQQNQILEPKSQAPIEQPNLMLNLNNIAHEQFDLQLKQKSNRNRQQTQEKHIQDHQIHSHKQVEQTNKQIKQIEQSNKQIENQPIQSLKQLSDNIPAQVPEPYPTEQTITNTENIINDYMNELNDNIQNDTKVQKKVIQIDVNSVKDINQTEKQIVEPRFVQVKIPSIHINPVQKQIHNPVKQTQNNEIFIQINKPLVSLEQIIPPELKQHSNIHQQ